MSAKAPFTTDDLYFEFKAQGHNPRTHHAWDHGIEAAVFGKSLLYQAGSRDYADAELAGYRVAALRLKKGRGWRCHECGHVHAPSHRGEPSA